MKWYEFLATIFGIFSVNYGSALFKDWLDNRRKEHQKPSLGDNDHFDRVQPILENIREEFNADSVCLWEGSNGETTLSGFHKKKLSVVAESVSDYGFSTIKDIENIPVYSFRRQLTELKHSEKGYVVSYEFDKHDELSGLYMNYNIGTIAVFKVCTGKSILKWTGLLTIGFKDKPKLLTDVDLAWLNTQAARIGSKLTI